MQLIEVVFSSTSQGRAHPLFALLAACSVYARIYLHAIAAGGDQHFLCDVPRPKSLPPCHSHDHALSSSAKH
jgi:hypothetical protein